MPPLTATTPLTSSESREDWFILHGYPCVLTPDRSVFHTFHHTIPWHTRPITTQYGETLHIEAMGIIILKVLPSSYICVEAAYVPQAHRNVFPIFVFFDIGWAMLFDMDGIDLFSPDDMVNTLRATRTGTPESVSHCFKAEEIPASELPRVADDVSHMDQELEIRQDVMRTREFGTEIPGYVLDWGDANGVNNYEYDANLMPDSGIEDTEGSGAIGIMLDGDNVIEMGGRPFVF